MQISVPGAIKMAVDEYYLKEIRAQTESESIQRLYSMGIVDREMLFKLLPVKNAEAIIISVEAAKKAHPVAKKCLEKGRDYYLILQLLSGVKKQGFSVITLKYCAAILN